jgi:hypothetical protein
MTILIRDNMAASAAIATMILEMAIGIVEIVVTVIVEDVTVLDVIVKDVIVGDVIVEDVIAIAIAINLFD